MLLVVGLGIGGWAFGTGRLGFGPLSKDDKAAAKAIADGADDPSWADDAQRSCAATKLLHAHRSGDLLDRGVVEHDGDGWRFTDEWDTDTARAYADGVLECSDDWKKQIASSWHLDDTGCLDDVGRSSVADSLLTTVVLVDDKEASAVHDAAAAKLDKCYGGKLDAITVSAHPGDRAVEFHLTLPEAANAETSVSVDGPDGTEQVAGTSYHAKTEEGGDRVCIDVTLEAHYGWGSKVTSGPTHACGKAKPKRLWWTRLPHCSYEAGCISWGLHASGFATGVETLRITSAAGDCPFASGDCTKSAIIGSDGRGFDKGMVLEVTGGAGRRTDDIIAKMGGLTARLHE
ncbi:hypothetical protein GCM10027076_00930 [Nocardioides montaniterrae]